ncbi:MAG TPA: hypothetical protein VFD92_23140 [Candidatus Binatia bacterium]|nr:hypothetical protein [Candidatus Binatia bacterium]
MLVAALALGLPAAARATVASDLCTGNPCVITGNHTIDIDSNLQFGDATDLVIQNSVLTVGDGNISPRTIGLTARSITMKAGARIVAGPVGATDDAEVDLTATGGDIVFEAASGKSIDLSSNSAGTASLLASGNITLARGIDVQGTGMDSAGGAIELEAGGFITVSADLLAGASGAFAFGGEIDITAGTGALITGMLDVGSPTDGGGVSVASTLGPVTVGKINANGGDPDGYGGEIEVDAGYGDVALNGPVTGNGGGGSDENCGDGGEFDVSAGLSVAINDSVTLDGGTGCAGGGFSVEAGTTVTQKAGNQISLDAPGTYGAGGALDVEAFGDIVLRSVDASSPGIGGDVDLTSRGGAIRIAGTVDVRASAVDAYAGTMSLRACTVQVTAQGSLLAFGGLLDDQNNPTVGIILLRASNAITVAGTVHAIGRNDFRLKSGQPTVTGTVTPSAVVTVDPAIPACEPPPVCGNDVLEPGELCDDGSAVNGTAAGCCAADCKSAKADGASCDDGLFCNGADTCKLTTCSAHVGNPCAGLPGACVTSSCTEQLHCAMPAESVCDDADDNPCTEGRCSAEGACQPTPIEADCEDGIFCNGSETCVAGKCRREPLACSADSCDENGAACEAFCGDGIAQDGEECGEPGTAGCAAGVTCRDCACETDGMAGDAYLCHKTTVSDAPASPFVPGSAVPVVDRFESKTYDVTSIDGVCSPVVVAAPQGTFPPTNPDTLQVDHTIALSATPPDQAPFAQVVRTYTDHFGTLSLTLKKVDGVFLRARETDFGEREACSDSSTCSDGRTCQGGNCLPDPAKAPGKPPKNLPVFNFKCYTAAVTAGTTKFTRMPNVRLTDQYGQTQLYDLVKPVRVCSPATVAGQNVTAPSQEGQLTCYKAALSDSDPKQAPFRPHEVGLRYKGFKPAFLDVKAATELCMPSRIQP